MKRYLFGILAVAFAFGAVAFKAADRKKGSPVLVRYTGSVTSSTDVQTPGLWVYEPGGQDCPGNTNIRACEMIVNDSDLDVDDKLRDDFEIQATPSGSTYYVSSAPEALDIHNAPNP